VIDGPFSPPPARASQPNLKTPASPGPTKAPANWKEVVLALVILVSLNVCQIVEERKKQKEIEAIEAAEREKREYEARWHNVPEWKKKVLETQAKKQEVRNYNFHFKS
jgi:hypothetical protein